MKAERAGPLVSATARTIIAARLGAGVALFGLLVAACFRPGIADDYRHGYVEVYNRTLTAITFDHGWVPSCAMRKYQLPGWGPMGSASPTAYLPGLGPSAATPPEGAVRVAILPGISKDDWGIYSVVVSETGVETITRPSSEGTLPACAGRAPEA